MPPKGGNTALSDQEVAAAVDFMIARLSAATSTGEQPPAASSPTATARPGTDGPQPAVITISREHSSLALTRLLQGEELYHRSPPDSAIPDDKYGDEVRLGRLIFTETYRYARRYAGNDLTCQNCHMEAGRRPHAGPMWAAFGMYPAYRRKNDRNNTLEERIQDCFRFSLDGFAPTVDAPEIRALVSYFHFLAKGAPIGVDLPGRGFPQIVDTGYDPNHSRGGNIYKAKCAVCHGANGAGQAKEGGGYIFPPLWGLDSYNKAAGMYRVQLAAGYIKANMPVGQENSLTDQEALDVAAYMNLQLRPLDPRKSWLEGIFD